MKATNPVSWLKKLLLVLFTLTLSCNTAEKSLVPESMAKLEELKSSLGISAMYDMYWLDSVGAELKKIPAEEVPLAMLSEANRDLGWRYCDIKAFGPATIYFIEAKELAENANDPFHLTEATLALGWMFHRFQASDLAFQYYNEALKASYLAKNANLKARAYHELAKTSLYTNQYEQARKYANYGLQLSDVTNKSWIVQLQNDVGLSFLEEKKYEEARVAFEKAIEFAGDELYSAGYVYGNLAYTYMAERNFTEAAKNLKRDFDISLQLADYPSAASSAIDIADCYTELGYQKQAMAYLQKADSLFLLDPEKNFHTNNLKSWQKLLGRIDNASEKIAVLNTLVELQNDRLKAEMKENNRQLTAVLQIIKQDKNLKSAEKTASKALQLKSGYVYTAAVLLVLLVITYFFFANRNQMQKQTNRINQLRLMRKEQALKIASQQQELKEYELKLQKELAENQALRMEQMQRFQTHTQLSKSFIEDMTMQLAEAIKDTLQNETKLYPPIRAKLESSLRMFEQSKQTKTNISIPDEENTNLFIERLKSAYPQLSSDEVKLCTYLWLDMSTKEIASVKMITVAGVNKSRNRIRKKLELEPSDDLFEFLRRI